MERNRILSWVLGFGVWIFAPHSLIAETQFFHSDHLGSSTLVTHADGQVVQSGTYSPFGEPLTPHPSPSPLWGEGWGEGATAYLYTGQELDAESALYDYGARSYDAALSRFVSADPVLGNPPYSYVQNNPIQRIDPNGKDDEDFQELLRRFESSSRRLGEKIARLASEASRLAAERYAAEWDSLPQEQRGNILENLTHRDPATNGYRIQITVESMMAKSLAKELKAKIDEDSALIERLDARQLMAYTELTKGLPESRTLHFSSVDGEKFSGPLAFPVNLDPSLGQNTGYGTPEDSALKKIGLPGQKLDYRLKPNPWVSPNMEELRQSLGTNPGYGWNPDWGSLAGPLFVVGVTGAVVGCALFSEVCGAAATLATVP
ncbi:MAG: hypothetical protein HY538_02205 [Deltaproteobacteria bacterium]|nr:hypothetical protein [Deltaproteobacteria bacterium]